MRYLLISAPFPTISAIMTGFMASYWHWFFGLVALGFLYDVYKRMQDFLKVRRMIEYGHGPHKVTKIFKHSMCQRHAALVAAYSMSHNQFFWYNKIFKRLGYRWYHIFPDAGLHSFKFWKGFLFR